MAATAQQLGIPSMQHVFNNQNLIPGAGDAIAQSAPIAYYVNGQQIALPPVNTIGAAATVPPLPDGLQVQYAPSFMGYPIPANMPKPISNFGQLQIYPLQLPGAVTGTDTNNMLLANNKVLLNILMAALLPLIQSYSHYPYGQDESGLGTLSDMVLNNRDTTDFLVPKGKQTLVGHIVSQAVDVTKDVISSPIYKTVASTAANIVAPGSGSLVNAALNKVAPTPTAQAAKQVTQSLSNEATAALTQQVTTGLPPPVTSVAQSQAQDAAAAAAAAPGSPQAAVATSVSMLQQYWWIPVGIILVGGLVIVLTTNKKAS